MQKGYEAAYAISKLSNVSKARSYFLALETLSKELQSEKIVQIVAKSDMLVISEKAKECSGILRKAASEIDLDEVFKTRMKASPNIDKGLDLGR